MIQLEIALTKSALLDMDARLSRGEITHRHSQTIYSVKAASGTPYDCTQADIDAFCKPPRNVRSSRFLPAEVSIQTLTSFLSQQTPTPDVCDALARLRLAVWDPDWGPDIIIKALRDIDIDFFNSRLRGNVKVHWCDSSNEIMRKHLPHIPLGLRSPGERKGQCTVFLNADMIFANRNPCKQMWRTILHELVHAYLYVTTGGKFINGTTLYDDYRSFRKHHGWGFCWLLNHVHRRIKASLNLRLLTGHDRDRMFLRHEWELTYKDAIKLDRLRLDRPISDSGDGRQRLLEDVIRFRHTPAYYERLPLGNIQQPAGVLRREDNKGKPSRVRSPLRGLEKVVLWFSRR